MLLRMDFASETPIYLQIRNQVVQGIASGALQPGERLPTIRALADESGINMMTVNKAYQLLKQEGYIETDRRSGAKVAGGVRLEPGGLAPRSREALRLIASEAKIAGLSEDQFLQLCAKAYTSGEEERP